MSRGLGKRQRLFLAALYSLECERGGPKPNGEGRAFWVWGVVQEAWAMELRDVVTARDRRHKAMDRAFLAELGERARAGDDGAAGRLSLELELRRLEAVLARGSGRVRPRGEAARTERLVNPSRVLGLLAARGLVERSGGTGRGAWVALTRAGRDLAASALYVPVVLPSHSDT